VLGNPALLVMDTFSAHMTDNVKDAFKKCNSKLLFIPGGCTSVLQPLDIGINKPFKSYIRQSWCNYMIEETDKSMQKIKPPSKLLLLEWIKRAQNIIESKPSIVKKSFLVAGISNASDEQSYVRDDSTYAEIQGLMEEVFGNAHMGYIEPDDSEDPFKDCSDASSDCQTESCDDDPFTTDPFATDNDSED